jgi:hypothetical protein
MTTILRARAAALTMLITAAPAAAQDVLHYHAAPNEAQQPGISVVAVDPISVGAPVRDAPYSAEAITEITQHLADGNRIERRTTATIARSGDGRTRREQQGFAFGGFIGQSAQPIVTITDPATGMHITLNYDLRVAFRMKPGRVGRRLDGGGPTVPAGRPESGAGAVSVGERGPRAGARRVMPPPSAPPDVFFEAPMIATAPIAAEPAMAWGGETKTESLEPRTIDGLRADGTRVTLTIPAGAVGNALPIEVVSERWFSPELQILLMTRRSDPRFGETVYRLTNIMRGEPAAELFRVPADFRVEDMTP